MTECHSCRPSPVIHPLTRSPGERKRTRAETSADPKVVALVRRHAEVVSLFIENGMQEMMRSHEAEPGLSAPDATSRGVREAGPPQSHHDR